MREVLCRVAHSDRELPVGDLLCLGEIGEIKEELERLKSEGLLEHNVVWAAPEVSLGRVSGLTPAGVELLRCIENERVWAIVCETLEAAGLDLSYPLLKEVCDEIVKRYVMGKIPDEM